MKIVVLDSLKRRNNARSQLAAGLMQGFSSVDGCETVCVQDKGEYALEYGNIPADAQLIILPFWIGANAFDMPIAELKRRFPRSKIALYTGTSPFWEGCSWVNYDPGPRSLDPVGLSSTAKDNFDAVDAWLVVHPRKNVAPLNQFSVGMGLFSECRIDGKSQTPFIILDYLKQGWDEGVYMEAVKVILSIIDTIPNVRVLLLGSNDLSRRLPAASVATIPHAFVPWNQMAAVYRQAWAFIAHNESFGYPIVENMACGTSVFACENAEIPECHKTNPLSGLASWIERVRKSSDRNALFSAVRCEFEQTCPQFCSWKHTAENILGII